MRRETLINSEAIWTEAVLTEKGIELWCPTGLVTIPEWFFQALARRYARFLGVPFDAFWDRSDPPA